MDDRNYDRGYSVGNGHTTLYVWPPAVGVNQENSPQSSEESESDTEDNPGHRRNGTIW